MNKWNIPSDIEDSIRKRDLVCIYCNKKFSKKDIKDTQTWEHIDNDVLNISLENIALCCFSCNASKGAKCLADWLQTEYCVSKGITALTIAKVALDTLKEQ